MFCSVCRLGADVMLNSPRGHGTAGRQLVPVPAAEPPFAVISCAPYQCHYDLDATVALQGCGVRDAGGRELVRTLWRRFAIRLWRHVDQPLVSQGIGDPDGPPLSKLPVLPFGSA